MKKKYEKFRLDSIVHSFKSPWFIFFDMYNVVKLWHEVHFSISYHSSAFTIAKFKKGRDIFKDNPSMCCMNTEKMSAAHRCVYTKISSSEK